MKRDYLFLAAFFALVLVVGLADRQTPMAAHRVEAAASPATAEYHWGPVEIEPFLYAIPLGTFTPYDNLVVYEKPDEGSPYVRTLMGGEHAEYTSEYRRDGETWLCVKWTVDDTIAAWRCSGWVLAGKDGVPLGEIDRHWEAPATPAPDQGV